MINISINSGILGDYATELTALAVAYRRNLERGHWQARELVSIYLGLPHLRGFWPMTSVDEGDDVHDLSGQGRTLTGNGALTFGLSGVSPSSLAPAVGFGLANPNRFLSRADEPGLAWDGLSSFMALAWVRPQVGAANSVFLPVVSKGDEADTLEYGVWVHDGTMRVKVAAGDEDYTAPESRALTNSAWNFVAAGYDGAADRFVVYVNGWHNTVQGNSPTLAATADAFYVGRVDNGAGSRRWRGELAAVGFFGEVLAVDLLENVYEGTRLLFGQ